MMRVTASKGRHHPGACDFSKRSMIECRSSTVDVLISHSSRSVRL